MINVFYNSSFNQPLHFDISNVETMTSKSQANQHNYIEGEGDTNFGATDFIEFYGQKNDGALDSLIYTYTPFVPNPYYSLVNDTAIYFLTWSTNSSILGKRMTPEIDVNVSAYPNVSNYFFKEEIQDFHSHYYDGETDGVAGTDARYVRSEGWFDGNTIDLASNPVVQYNNLVNTKNPYPAGPNALIKIVAVGASKKQGVTPDHRLQIDYRNASGNYSQIVDTTFIGYETNRFIRNNISPSLLNNGFTDFKFTK
jgi:hypothetical protein